MFLHSVPLFSFIIFRTIERMHLLLKINHIKICMYKVNAFDTRIRGPSVKHIFSVIEKIIARPTMGGKYYVVVLLKKNLPLILNTT